MEIAIYIYAAFVLLYFVMTRVSDENRCKCGFFIIEFLLIGPCIYFGLSVRFIFDMTLFCIVAIGMKIKEANLAKNERTENV